MLRSKTTPLELQSSWDGAIYIYALKIGVILCQNYIIQKLENIVILYKSAPKILLRKLCI
jgi:hypothetical protein